MKLTNMLPSLGSLPEIHTFQCQKCRQVLSIEIIKIGAVLPSVRPA